MALSLEFEFEDTQALYHTAMSAEIFRSEDQAGRFDTVGKAQAARMLPDMALASPVYENGSLLWCACAADAVLLKAIHKAEGYEAELLWDRAAADADETYVVLTSWNMHEGEAELTHEPVVAEIVFVGDAEDGSSDEAARALKTGLDKDETVEIVSAPNLDDHGDHFHITTIVRVSGLRLKPLLHEISHSVMGRLGYSILA